MVHSEVYNTKFSLKQLIQGTIKDKAIYRVSSKKCIPTLTADSSILKMEYIFISIAFITIPIVCIRFWDTLCIHCGLGRGKVLGGKKIF